MGRPEKTCFIDRPAMYGSFGAGMRAGETKYMVIEDKNVEDNGKPKWGSIANNAKQRSTSF